MIESGTITAKNTLFGYMKKVSREEYDEQLKVINERY
jgi:hypothetical protein